MKIKGFAAIFVVAELCPAVQAEQLDCNWTADRRVNITEGWIDAGQGRDEDGQRLRLAIWGPESIEAECAQLDDDPEPEVVVISRGIGTGPYYRLQIVDFHSQGIKTWAYSSDGAPKVADKTISLGRLVDGYQGAGSMPVYTDYRLTDDGLVDPGAETSWILFVAVTIDENEVRLPPVDQRSRESCEAAAEQLVAEFSKAGQAAEYACMSNLDIAKALEPFTN